MAEVVGLIASILQLVDAVARTREYIKDFHDARSDQKGFLLEVEGLRALLLELQKRSEPTCSARMDWARESLVRLKEMLDQMSKKLDPGRILEEGLDMIERFKTLFGNWLEIDIWDVAQKQEENLHDILESIQNTATGQRDYQCDILSSVKDIAEQQQDAHRMLETLRDNQKIYEDVKKRHEIIDWCSPINFFLRQEDIFAARQPGTGDWFLNSEEFKAWKAGLGAKLWCPGIPGAGKTVLMSIIVDHLRKNMQPGEHIGVAAIYLNHKETKIQTPPSLLASIWRQLVLQKPISLEIRQLYEKNYEACTRPSLEDFYQILCSAIIEYSKVYVVVDALDEYPEEQRNTLLNHLAMLGPTVNIMFTSRPHFNIYTIFSTTSTLEIRATEHDIRCYVNAQTSKSLQLSSHIKSRPSLGDEIETQIVGRSDGMFLLAKLHINSLTTKHTVKAIREALQSMPSDLQNSYDEVMARIDQQCADNRKLAQAALSWISNAKRLLRVAELREALAVEVGTSKLDPDNLVDIDTVLSVCAGLVIVDQIDNEIDGVVRLIHHTTQDYLDSIQPSRFPFAQEEITTTCVTYLSFDIFLKNSDLVIPRSVKKLRNVHPLLDYAVEFCLVHARGKPELTLREMLLDFLTLAPTRWIYIWAFQHGFPTLGIRWSKSRLWIAAFFNLCEIAHHLVLIKETADIGIALQAAIVNGHQEMLQLLMASGADANLGQRTSSDCTESALQIASYFGYVAVVSLLIDKGNINVLGGKYNMVLPQAAAAQGHAAVVHLLLENGADVNSDGGIYEAALQACLTRGIGWKEVARMLLQHGADVNAQGAKRGQNARGLHATRNIKSVKLKARDLGTALQMASARGHEDVVRQLLENGANADTVGGFYNSALRAAAMSGNENIARLLITHDTGVNLSNTGHSTLGMNKIFERPGLLPSPLAMCRLSNSTEYFSAGLIISSPPGQPATILFCPRTPELKLAFGLPMKTDEGQSPLVGVPLASRRASISRISSPSLHKDSGLRTLQRTNTKNTNIEVVPINVLIVEDNVINQRQLAQFMRKKKLNFQVANNGLEAVHKWKTGNFNLILMDIQMPVMDGIEATKEIRRLEKMNATEGYVSLSPSYSVTATSCRSSVIIVAQTASSHNSDRVKALAAGCNDFLTKSVNNDWLSNKVTEWGSIMALQMWADKPPLSGSSQNVPMPHPKSESAPAQAVVRTESAAAHPDPPSSRPKHQRTSTPDTKMSEKIDAAPEKMDARPLGSTPSSGMLIYCPLGKPAGIFFSPRSQTLCGPPAMDRVESTWYPNPHAPSRSSSTVRRSQKPSHKASRLRAQKTNAALDMDIAPPISVLIVEDNIINQRQLTQFMQKKKLNFQVANNGLEAVNKWKTGNFNLILMDIQMPVMDGIEATKEIRRLEKMNAAAPASSPVVVNSALSVQAASPYRSSVIIVAQTASSLNSVMVKAFAAGCNDFLTKSANNEWLSSKVAEWGSIMALQMWTDMPTPAGSDQN
ncbi:hypothetical protein DFH09DRAFT_1354883 [Mycena vulgaris]|nr:hypothetical protein DFH09DRAFT_1354883 [Mycena vulgaris]